MQDESPPAVIVPVLTVPTSADYCNQLQDLTDDMSALGADQDPPDLLNWI